MPNFRRHHRGVGGRAHGEVRKPPGKLRIRPKDYGRSVLADVIVFEISENAYDRDLQASIAEPKPFAQRGPAGKEPARQRFIHDYDFRGRERILRAEGPSGPESDTHRLEVAGCDEIPSNHVAALVAGDPDRISPESTVVGDA